MRGQLDLACSCATACRFRRQIYFADVARCLWLWLRQQFPPSLSSPSSHSFQRKCEVKDSSCAALITASFPPGANFTTFPLLFCSALGLCGHAWYTIARWRGAAWRAVFPSPRMNWKVCYSENGRFKLMACTVVSYEKAVHASDTLGEWLGSRAKSVVRRTVPIPCELQCRDPVGPAPYIFHSSSRTS